MRREGEEEEGEGSRIDVRFVFFDAFCPFRDFGGLWRSLEASGTSGDIQGPPGQGDEDKEEEGMR